MIRLLGGGLDTMPGLLCLPHFHEDEYERTRGQDLSEASVTSTAAAFKTAQRN